MKKNVYKIGRTKRHIFDRIRGRKEYGKDPDIYTILQTSDCITLEKRIIQKFKDNFILYQGAEWFRGDIEEMMKIVYEEHMKMCDYKKLYSRDNDITNYDISEISIDSSSYDSEFSTDESTEESENINIEINSENNEIDNSCSKSYNITHKYGKYTDLILGIKCTRSRRKIISVISKHKFLKSEFIDLNIDSLNIEYLKNLLITYIEFYNICTFKSSKDLSEMSKIVLKLLKVLFDKLDNPGISVFIFGSFVMPSKMNKFNKVIDSYNRMNRRLKSGKEHVNLCGGKPNDYVPIRIVENDIIGNWTSLIKLDRSRSNMRTRYNFVIDPILLTHLEHLHKIYG